MLAVPKTGTIPEIVEPPAIADVQRTHTLVAASTGQNGVALGVPVIQKATSTLDVSSDHLQLPSPGKKPTVPGSGSTPAVSFKSLKTPSVTDLKNQKPQAEIPQQVSAPKTAWSTKALAKLPTEVPDSDHGELTDEWKAKRGRIMAKLKSISKFSRGAAVSAGWYEV